jgi:hypothetical protein
MLCGAAAVLAGAAPAAQAADWRDGGFLTDPSKHARSSLETVTSGDGDAFFNWGGYEEVGPGSDDRDWRPRGRTRPSGGDPTAERLLSNRYERMGASANDQGDLLLVSHEPPQEGDFFEGRILARSGTVRGGASDEQVVFATGPAERICGYRGAVGPDGRAIVLYGVAPPDPRLSSSADDSRCELRMRMRPSRETDFGPELTIGEPASRLRTEIEFDGLGRAIVAWAQRGGDPRALFVPGGGDATIGAVRADPAAGTAKRQDIAVPGETASDFGVSLGVAVDGRAVIGFASRRPGGEAIRVAAATGDTRAGFGPASVLSGPAYLRAARDLDTAIGDDGTTAVTWRAGTPLSYKVQAAVARSGEELSARSTTSLSRSRGRVPQASVGGGRVTIAWIALVSGRGRSIEATSGRAGEGFARARVISETEVSNRPPEVVRARRGAAWILWGERPTDSTTYQFRVLKASKRSVRGNRFSRVLDVLRGRSGERIGNFDAVPLTGDAMLATVERERPRPDRGDWHGWYQLRTYGE